ncbi:MAG: DUF2892 domain-containing protein [Polaromonas sp.]|uniref:YgaP family membrane protein n=1 Tax=Polaromonas sp. TaxID=1869339 RepID=UPI0018221F41|nr:DUF2892 domain-containing protein [Polaromonas sp.]NMM10853.1 DUF2892 domain-containing protein [Polaromonas sp.]
MTTDRMVRMFAGIFILISLGLGVPESPLFLTKYFLWFTVFVGANLLQSSFTQFCPLEILLKKAGVRDR